MTKGNRVFLTAMVGTCVAGMLLAVLIALQPTPERALFNQIHEGMTLTEAQTILVNLERVQGSARGDVKAEYIWIRNDQVVIAIQINADDRITKKVFADQGWLAKLRRQLGL